VANTKQQEGGPVFLGFTNFYRRFIQGFSDLTRPMFDLTRRTPHGGGEAEKSAFEAIRTRVISTPILVFPDENPTIQS